MRHGLSGCHNGPEGNLIELAIAFVMGIAFSTLVTAFVDNLINPLIGAIFGQPNFSGLTIDVWSGAVLRYGSFLNDALTFLAVAAAQAVQRLESPF
jgi:large conductance mechanosensitive channel